MPTDQSVAEGEEARKSAGFRETLTKLKGSLEKSESPVLFRSIRGSNQLILSTQITTSTDQVKAVPLPAYSKVFLFN